MTEPSSPPSLTAAAARRVREIAAGEGRASVLRLEVSGGGCAGFRYGFSLADAPAAEDFAAERDGAVLVVDPASLGLLAGAEVDFVEDMMGAAFQVRNPNASSSCGCGSSFSPAGFG